MNSTLCVLSPKSMSDQVVRVIVIQKTLIEHAEKLRQVKTVLEEDPNSNKDLQVKKNPIGYLLWT
ncbi:hypothetical protein YC2023_067086 [Brassica napus]